MPSRTDPIEVSYRGKVGDRPPGYENPELLRVKADRQHSDTIVNGVSRIGHMGGGESALWVDEEFPDIFTEKAVEFVRASRARARWARGATRSCRRTGSSAP